MKCSRWICLLLFAATSVSALDVQQVKWGFGGQVVPNRFNLVSVLVANSSADPFDGSLTLFKSRGLAERVGALYETPCYVSPFTTRWVQFYVYTENQYDQWRLEWGRAAEDHRDLDAPKWGPPAQVLLSDSEITLSVFKRFPDELFPSTAAATGGLDSVLLDHAPRWESAKRQAFLNWLRTGGKVHLLLDANGHYPVFSDELSVLNFSSERSRIGSGIAVRHAATVHEIRKEDVEEGEFPPRQIKVDDPPVMSQSTDSFLQVLSGLSHPRHSWGWIFVLAFAYVALVGPGNFIASRKVPDYRLRIALLLGTIAGFAWLFNVVGRRGQGESSVIHSLSYARAINGDTYEVTQWINLFATRGAHYTIQHSAPHNLYATGQDYEAVNGWIESGKDGKFIVDIPMYSRRALLHQAEMKGADISVKIVNWEGAGKLKQLTLTVGSDFTKQILDAWVVQGNQIYTMKVSEGRLEVGNSYEEPLSALMSAPNPAPSGYMGRAEYESEPVNEDAEFRKLAKPLIAWSLRTQDFTLARMSSGEIDRHAQLFIFARSPQGFCVTGSQFGHEIGCVLYHLDLFKPGS